MRGRLLLAAALVAVAAIDTIEATSEPLSPRRICAYPDPPKSPNRRPGRSCRARIPKARFNVPQGRCEVFLYNGCDFPVNMFDTILECHNMCGEPYEVTDKAAHVKSEYCLRGPILDGERECRAAFPRFTFNPETLSCERYLYGGCGASQNVFNSQEECAAACFHGEPIVAPPPATPKGGGTYAVTQTRGIGGPAAADATAITYPDEDICQLPPVTPGLFACLMHKPMWTYDAKQAKCVEYVYGGCRGTKNLFATEDDCKAKCPMKKTEVTAGGWNRPEKCSLPPLSGTR